MKKTLISILCIIFTFSFFVLHLYNDVISFVASRGEVYNANYDPNDYLNCILILDDDAIINNVKLDDLNEETLLIKEKIQMQTYYKDYLTNNFFVNFNDSYNYTYLFNGFSGKVKYQDLDQIYDLDFIKDIIICNTYECLNTEYNLLSLNDEIIYSDNLMNSQKMVEAGYTGKGTAVAIIDTGMDVTHEAFQNKVENPKYSQDDIENIIQNMSLNATGVYNSDQVYYSDKIPFTYDYADKDANVYSSSLMHGAHVAGIVGANAGQTRGVATDCQIFAMKVFGDDGYSTSDAILAAVEDACKFGVDVINMSLGSASGNTYTDEQTALIYQNVREYGINLVVASGNDAYMGYNNQYGNNLPLASTPDYGLTGSPATYPWSTAVGSFNNPYYFYDCLYANDYCLPFFNTSYGEDIRNTLDGQTIEYVEIPNYGKEEDYEGIDVVGKIALVKRGEISFTEKHNFAYEAGAIAMIAYDPNDDVFVTMQIEDQKIPCAFIAKAYFEVIKNKGYKTFTFKKDAYEQVEDLISGKTLSEFSSFGTADLQIKPDISGPGGNIYAPLIDNEYAQMSGTSMACPNISGLLALTREYLKKNFASLTKTEEVDISTSLLMSSATIQKDKDGNPYLVRAQGSGLGNGEGILNAHSYLEVVGNSKPKAELGASIDGNYSFEVKINNFSNEDMTYYVNGIPLAETYVFEQDMYFASTSAKCLSVDDCEITFSNNVINGQVFAKAHSEVTVEIKIALTEKFKKAQDKIFTNGSFIEGYLVFNYLDEILSVPFLGFYGDWDQITLFEDSLYDSSAIANMQPSLAVAFDASGTGYELGYNLASNMYDGSKIYFTTSTLKNFSITSYSGLRRNVNEMLFQIFDQDDNLVYENRDVNYKKSLYFTSGEYIVAAYDNDLGWDGTKKDGTKALNGEVFKYVTTAYRKDQNNQILYEESWSFNFTIDNLSPSLVSYEVYQENDQVLLKVIAKDNMNIAYISLLDYDMNITLRDSFVNTSDELTTTAIFDITNLYQDLSENSAKLGEIKVGIFDWAYNFTYETVTIGPSVISLDKEYHIGVGGIKDLNMQISPSSVTYQDLIFTSSDESVATVEAGIVKGIAKGEANITIKGLNGYEVQTKIIVSGVADTKIEILKEDFSMHVNEIVGLKVRFTPTYVTDNSVIWSSSDETIATVTQNGVVTALKEGTVQITGTSANGNKDTITIIVEPPVVTSIKIYLFSKTIKVGQIINLDSLTVSPSNVDLTKLIYTSSDENVATIDNYANIKGIGEGTATLRVSSPNGNIFDEVTIKVVNVEATTINISSNLSINIGDSFQLEPEILPLNTTNKTLKYTSTNELIATIDEKGKISTHNVGVTIVTITCGTIKKEVSVSVLPIEATSIKIDLAILEMNMNESKTLNVSIAPENVTYPNVIWKSNDNSICTVYNGVVKALNPGYTIVEATLENGVSAQALVIVNKVSNLDLVEDIYLTEKEKFILPTDYKYQIEEDTLIVALNQNEIIGLKEGKAPVLVQNEIGESKTIYIYVSKARSSHITLILTIFSGLTFISLIYCQIKLWRKK